MSGPARVRILVVDDDEVDRRIIRRAVGREGSVEVTEARDAAEALARAREGTYDLVLLDFLLPDADGEEVLRGLRELGVRAPVVVLTGHGNEEVAVRMMKAGAADYVPKSGLTPQRLQRTVDGALGLARRLAEYEAAIARETASRGAPPDATTLRDLRQRLGIPEAEQPLVTRMAGGRPPTETGIPAALEVGVLVSGRYRLESLLGKGSFGRAFLGRDETLGRMVVLKVLHAHRVGTEKELRDFLREARVAASFEHPAVVRVYDFGYAGAVPFIVMEFAEGGSLADLLQGRERLPAVDVVRIMDQVLAGLAYMHGRGFVHRDVKPANILLASEGVAKLTDFGLTLGEDAEATHDGLAGGPPPAFRGTPAYMSPEAVKGFTLSPSSDVYAAGAVLYEMAAGRPYLDLEGRSAEEIRRAIVHDAPREPVPPADPHLRSVWTRALAKEPRDRYATAEEMRKALMRPRSGA